MRVLWRGTSQNGKTGNVPTGWVGETLEEVRLSCQGCALLDCGCYAHNGRTGVAGAGLRAAAAKLPPLRYSLQRALEDAARSAKMVRLGALGDPGRLGKAAADEIGALCAGANLALVGYTQHWREPAVAEAWKGRIMASCLDEASADRAVAEGWRAALVVPRKSAMRSLTRRGRSRILCPEQGKGRTTCNECRLCDGSKPGPIIDFWAHGGMAGVVERLLQRLAA